MFLLMFIPYLKSHTLKGLQLMQTDVKSGHSYPFQFMIPPNQYIIQDKLK